MTEQLEDEVGGMSGPQAAAKAELGATVVGVDGDGGPGDQAPPPQGPDEETWLQVLEPLIGAAFTLLGSRWPSMAAKPGEVEMLAKVWAPVAEKHAGAAIPIEYVALGATGAVLLPKLVGAFGEHKAAKAEAARQAAEKRARDPGTVHP